MEAGLQYRSRTMSSPHFDCYHYTPCARSKTSDADLPPFTITRLRFPPRRDGACRYEPPPPSPPPLKRTSQSPPWVRKDVTFVKPTHKPSIEAWVDEQVHLSDRSNYDLRAPTPIQTPPIMVKEELRQRMRDELVYEYEAEAHKWMSRETEMRRRAQAREREEARRRIVQEDIMRIQARVRERRDSERRVIAEERRRSVERDREKVRRDQAERAVLDAWQAYEARWAEVSASSESLGFGDIPWLVLEAPVRVADLTPEHISGFLLHPAHSSNHSRRERIRTALLRWHPDRFRRILNRVADSEKDVVEEGVGVIARCLNELLAKEGKGPQQVSISRPGYGTECPNEPRVNEMYRSPIEKTMCTYHKAQLVGGLVEQPVSLAAPRNLSIRICDEHRDVPTGKLLVYLYDINGNLCYHTYDSEVKRNVDYMLFLWVGGRSSTS